MGLQFIIGGFSSLNLPGGSGGGGGSATTALRLQTTITAGENLTAGNIVRLGLNALGETAGRTYKAQSDSTDHRGAIGVAFDTVTAGAVATVVLLGSVPITFGVTPASTDNGKPVYLDASSAGGGTITPPSAGGTSILQIGYLVGGTGADPTPDVVLTSPTLLMTN